MSKKTKKTLEIITLWKNIALALFGSYSQPWVMTEYFTWRYARSCLKSVQGRWSRKPLSTCSSIHGKTCFEGFSNGLNIGELQNLPEISWLAWVSLVDFVLFKKMLLIWGSILARRNWTVLLLTRLVTHKKHLHTYLLGCNISTP